MDGEARHLLSKMADLDPGVESSSLPGSLRQALGRSSPVFVELLCHDHGAAAIENASAFGRG